MRIGDWDVVAVETGRFKLDGGAMFGVVPKTLWEKEHPADEANRVELSLRCLFLQGHNRRLLVDTGMGDKWSEELRARYDLRLSEGGVAGALAKLGVPAETVTDVVLTHLHFDHAGGATRLDENGTLTATFPNARYRVQSRNIEWARKPNERERASYLPENFEPLVDEDRLELLDGPCDVLPGVTVAVSDGHTEGLQMVRVNGEGEDGEPAEVWYTADVVPTASHVHAPWIAAYDIAAIRVLEEKQALLGGLAGRNAWLVFEHDPRVAAARIARDGSRYRAIDLKGELD